MQKIYSRQDLYVNLVNTIEKMSCKYIKRNEAVLNDQPGELYTIESNDKIPDNCKYPLALIQATHNQKQTNRGCLAKLPKLKTGAKVMLTVNIGTQGRLISGQTELGILDFLRVVLVKYI